MLLINKLTAPGGIQRVEIRPETVRIMTRGQPLTAKAASLSLPNPEGDG